MMGEIKPVILLKNELELRENFLCLPWSFGTVKILMQEKNNDTPFEQSSKSPVFSIDFLSEEPEVVAARTNTVNMEPS